MFIFVLILLVLTLSTLLSMFIYYGLKAARLNQHYEEFYVSTLDDIDVTIKMLDDLIHKRHLVSDDPDVQNVYKTIVIIYDTLSGYQNAAKKKERKD